MNYFDDNELNEAFIDFLDMRKKIKKLEAIDLIHYT